MLLDPVDLNFTWAINVQRNFRPSGTTGEQRPGEKRMKTIQVQMSVTLGDDAAKVLAEVFALKQVSAQSEDMDQSKLARFP
jgi:hypothetical protein